MLGQTRGDSTAVCGLPGPATGAGAAACGPRAATRAAPTTAD